MGVYVWDGHVLFVDNQVAMSVLCCCGGPATCDWARITTDWAQDGLWEVSTNDASTTQGNATLTCPHSNPEPAGREIESVTTTGRGWGDEGYPQIGDVRLTIQFNPAVGCAGKIMLNNV